MLREVIDGFRENCFTSVSCHVAEHFEGFCGKVGINPVLLVLWCWSLFFYVLARSACCFRFQSIRIFWKINWDLSHLNLSMSYSHKDYLGSQRRPTCAIESVSKVTVNTRARKGTNRVRTRGVRGAVVSLVRALVDVWKTNGMVQFKFSLVKVQFSST